MRLTSLEMAEDPAFDDDAYDVLDQREVHDDQLDDLADLSTEEQELMKMWNAWVEKNRAYGDNRYALMCQQFVEDNAHAILDKRLRHNFLVKLLNDIDFGLLSADEAAQLMKYVDTIATMRS